ncbi:hypothetical protein RJT34_15065 [Clitoria ternatea]|uniref:Uncharacterized protein n=1 Tax=Clitoria ternatea TaxID=43366 RepID=A0AAN9JU98_CLITE
MSSINLSLLLSPVAKDSTHPVSPLVEEIRLLAYWLDITLSYVWREANSIADGLAKLSHNLDIGPFNADINAIVEIKQGDTEHDGKMEKVDTTKSRNDGKMEKIDKTQRRQKQWEDGEGEQNRETT